MNPAKKIASNTLYQAGGRVIGTALAFFMIYLLSRYLGPGGYGEFITILAIVQFVGIIADLGLHLATLQDIAKENADKSKIIGLSFTLRCVINIIIFLILIAIVPFLPYSSAIKWGIIIMNFGNLFVALNQILTTTFQENLKTFRVALSEIIGRAVNLLAIVAVIHFNGGIVWMSFTVALGFLTNVFFTWTFGLKYIRLRFRVDWQYWKDLAKRTWPVSLSIIFTLIYFKTDTIILSLFQPKEEVGIYGIPYRILETLATFPPMFVMLIMPFLTRAYESKDHKKFNSITQSTFDVLAALAIPLSFGAYVLGTPIVRLVAGDKYDRAIPILAILMAATGMIFLSSTFMHLAFIIGKQRAMLKYYIFTALFALSTYLIFIPMYSIWAAAIFTLIAESMVFIFSYLVARRYTKFRLNLDGVIKSIIAGAGMSFVLWQIKNASLALTLPAGIVVYAAILLLINPNIKEKARMIIVRD